MRIFLEVIENLTDSVRVIVGFVVLLIMGSAMIFSFGVSYVATGAAEDFAASAEELGKEAIKAQREAELNRALAEDGWGYQAGHVDPAAANSRANSGTYSGQGPARRRDAAGELGADDWASGS